MKLTNYTYFAVSYSSCDICLIKLFTALPRHVYDNVESLLLVVVFISQVVRDFGLLLPDILAVVVVILESTRLARNKRVPVRSLFYKEEVGFTLLITTFMVVVGKSISF